MIPAELHPWPPLLAILLDLDSTEVAHKGSVIHIDTLDKEKDRKATRVSPIK